MKYKIDKSDLFIDNKLHPEGSEVDLTKDQTKGIEDFLIPLESNSEGTVVTQKKLKTKSSVASAKEEKGNKK